MQEVAEAVVIFRLVVMEAEELLVLVIPVMLLLELLIQVVVAVVLDQTKVLIQTLRLVVQVSLF